MRNLEPSNFRATYKRTPRQTRVAKKQGEDNILPIIGNANVSIKDKRELIALHNPFHYVFGTALVRIKQEDLLTGVNTDEENQDE
jgi:hypothetical protein